MTDFNAQIIDEFRQNEGAVGGPLQGVPILLLTHQGVRTGAPRTTPLGYFEDAGRYVLYASNMGAAKTPDWYYNVLGEPRVEVECGTERFPAVASVLAADDPTGLRERVVEARPFLRDHAERAGRDIPLVILQRVRP